MSRKTFEKVAAWVGFAGAGGGGVLLAVTSTGVVRESIGLPISITMAVAGSVVFYGFGCFLVWPNDDPPPGQRSAIWFVHEYWLNAFGVLVGWIALFLIYRRFKDDVLQPSADTIVLALVAFLGLVGHLPFTITGIAVAIREVARKILEKV